ncbi:hypothetical protein ARMSODRAFT_980756 [Armillaria solidipes]|uniref:Uncharacterized protein n=1 Tax=Armillaria solidipes TaxID=1076256 RepID=A0A2H3AUX6_9AGAR|nr:hypothetical protein ARMSODRAFT_980756 [Armillaria solidipes]
MKLILRNVPSVFLGLATSLSNLDSRTPLWVAHGSPVNPLRHLRIQDGFDFLGHSWGKRLGLERCAKAAGGIAPLRVDQLFDGYGEAELHQLGSSKAFPESWLTTRRIWKCTVRVFDLKHGYLVDPEELVDSTNHGFINGSPLDVHRRAA